MSKNWIIATFILFLLTGCTGENCIEADDFGHNIITVGARYNKSDFNGQVGANQVAPWIASGYRVNGRPLTMTVQGWDYGVDQNDTHELSAWCAWYGSSAIGSKLSSFCERLQDCQFVDDTMCTNTANARIVNAPCLFRNGVGLYSLIAAKGTDPNQTLGSQRDPAGITFHLGEPNTGYTLYDIDRDGNTRVAAGRVHQFGSDEEKQEYLDSQLYFKILDKFYDDNSGQYRVVVKSGITSSNPDPISFVTKLVKQFLFGAQGGGNELLPGLAASNTDGVFDGNNGIIRNIYMGIVTNQGYRTAVSAMLTLYIMYTGLSYLAGNMQLTHTELIVRIGKIAIVSALLSSEYSWSFFNDYLFVYFIGGVEQVLQIIVEAGATGPGSPGILALMIAPQTLSKLFSLLFMSWLGWLYILLFGAALYFIVMIFFNAAVIYLSALIAIGMIIVMGPIFMCFLLFGITRSLFENWLKQLISYAIQPIILFTGLIFISMILRQEIYGALGFKVCKQKIFKMSTTPQIFGDVTKATLGFNPGDTMFYWWFPLPMKGENFTRTTVPIPVPIDHFTDDNTVIGPLGDRGFCEAYGCIEERYIDLPFLDPVKDQRRLTQFWNGQFVQLDGVILIFIALYLLHKFNGLAVSVTKFIAGTSGNYTSLSNVGDAVNAQSFGKANAIMASVPKQAGIAAVSLAGKGASMAGRAGASAFGKARQAGTNFVDKQIGKSVLKGQDLSGKSKTEIAGLQLKAGQDARSQLTASAIFDKLKVASLKKEALTGRANKAVLAEVKKKTGLDRSGIDPKASKNYRAALADKLKEFDPSLSNRNASSIANKMSRKEYSDMKDEFSKAKYGMSHSKLNPQQKADINKIHGDKNLRMLANDNAKSRQFKQAYVDAYAGMSDRGIGIVGKHNKTIRSLEEIRHSSRSRLDNKKKEETLKPSGVVKRDDKKLLEKENENELLDKNIKEVTLQENKEMLDKNITKTSLNNSSEKVPSAREKAKELQKQRDIKKILDNTRLDENKVVERLKLDKETLKSDSEKILSDEKNLKTNSDSKEMEDRKESLERTQGEFLKHDVNIKDARRETEKEALVEKEKSIVRADISRTIESYNKKYGEDVISPEFLAKAERSGDKSLDAFRNLEKQDVQSSVHEALRSGDDPSIMGDTYMSKYATDKEMSHMIDRAYEVQDEFYKKDKFISRESEYQATYDKAESDVKDAYSELSDYYKRDDIKPEEMPELMKEYLESEGKMGDKSKVTEKVEQLKKSIDDFGSSQEVLQQIDRRKEEVSQEIESQVSNINEHRTKANLKAYYPTHPNVVIRKTRTIDDLKRK
jgi:type IV secretion system protein VirB6